MPPSDDILEFRAAGAALAPFIFGYVRRLDHRGGDVVRVLPETRASIQTFRADPYWLQEDTPGAAWRKVPRIGLWGPRMVPAYGFAERTLDVFAIGLTPAGVRALTERPAGAFANDATAFAATDPVAGLLDDGLQATTDFDAWSVAADCVLTRAFASALAPSPIEKAVAALAATEGLISAAAATLGLSERHFRRLFAETHGAPPKVYARLLRFDAVLKALHPRPWEPKPALIPPYTDQSHLIREFCEFARVTPSAYVRNKERHGDRILRSIVVDGVAPP